MHKGHQSRRKSERKKRDFLLALLLMQKAQNILEKRHEIMTFKSHQIRFFQGRNGIAKIRLLARSEFL